MMRDVTMVRVYCTEAGDVLDTVLKVLEGQAVAGFTVFRGMEGLGPSGKRHGTGWLDLALDLPVTIEFFDRPDKVATVIERLAPLVTPGHLVTWGAQANLEN